MKELSAAIDNDVEIIPLLYMPLPDLSKKENQCPHFAKSEKVKNILTNAKGTKKLGELSNCHLFSGRLTMLLIEKATVM